MKNSLRFSIQLIALESMNLAQVGNIGNSHPEGNHCSLRHGRG